jgi:hypothetical protein
MDDDYEKSLTALAGQRLSSWLPKGYIRKILFFILLFIGLFGTFVLENGWYLLIMFIALILFSPRIAGEVAFLLGRLLSKK